MSEHIDDFLAREKKTKRVWSQTQQKFVSYENLNVDEQIVFDNKYPCYGYTYEEYCGLRS